MSDIVVLGAGLSGTIMAYELLPQLRKGDTLTVIGQGPRYHFVPSNPWVAIGWREQRDIEVDLVEVMHRKGIRYLAQGARRLLPQESRIELEDGSSVSYDYLVVATGPDLAFDEVPGLAQGAFPVHLSRRARRQGQGRLRAVRCGAGPDRGWRGAGCVLFRAGL
jgi:sulfide:quinone oxidoreductase